MNKKLPVLAICTFGLFGNATAQQLPRLRETSMDEVIKAMALDEKIDLLASTNMDRKPDDSTMTTIAGGTKKLAPGASATEGMIYY